MSDLLQQPNVIAAFLVGFLTAFLIFGALRRSLILILRLVRRFFGRPFRPLIRFARKTRLLRARSQATQSVAEGAQILDRGLGLETDVDVALRHVEGVGTDGQPAGHDFREEDALLTRTGLIFKSIFVPATYVPSHLMGALNDDVADQYVREATAFFSRSVALQANEKSLYEDAEGAFAISLFRSVDRRCYYILDQMRKTINGNARRLTLFFGAILAVWFSLALVPLLNVLHVSPDHATGGVPQPAILYEFISTYVTPNIPWLVQPTPLSIVIAVSLIVPLGLFFTVQNYGYRQQQMHNTRELNKFLIRYLGRIADRYREATGNAKQVTVGDETDSKKLSQAAKKWHKIMVWIPFRTFFIECFVRNVRYQIDRNCSYYLWIPWLTFIFLLILFQLGLAMSGLTIEDILNQASADARVGALCAVFAAATLIAFFGHHNRINAVVLGDELSHLDWLGYDNLNVSAAMDEVVGKYAEDVGFWKGRLSIG